MEAEVKRPKVIIEAVITRIDGTVEDLGVITKPEKIEIVEEVQNNG